LELPVGVNPASQLIIGVVTFSDPVANFDGAQIIATPGHF
jgi:hypothetical protein